MLSVKAAGNEILFNKNNPWFQHTLNAIHDAVLIADANCVVRRINDAYTRLKGIKPEQIIGRHILEVRPESLVPKVIKSGQPMLGILRRQKDFSYIVNITPIIIDQEIVGGIAVSKDITEVQKLSEQLQKSVSTIKSLRQQMQKAKYTFEDIIGKNEGLKEVVAMARRASRSDSNIMIRGESGTGKELLAHAIHNESNRKYGPFVAVNCSAIPTNLLESELFGYEEGAFTGAKKGGKAGLFEIADEGTIFLDEIGDMSLYLQAKILRVLQDKRVRRVGSTRSMDINARVITATNRNLEEMVEKNMFREDLFYRLNVFPIIILPLRERKQDIAPLVSHLLQRFSREFCRRVGIAPQVLELLKRFNWPGNVRELANVIEFAFNMADNELICLEHLPKYLQGARPDEAEKELDHLNERQVELLAYLKEHGKITNRHYVNIFAVNRSTAFRDLSGLVKDGIIELKGAGRSAYYVIKRIDANRSY